VENEEETRERRNAQKSQPMGVWKISTVSPHRVPKKVEWGAIPRVIASSHEEGRRLWEAYCWVIDAYYEAREARDATRPVVPFPEGAFPSPRCFVGVAEARGGPQSGRRFAVPSHTSRKAAQVVLVEVSRAPGFSGKVPFQAGM